VNDDNRFDWGGEDDPRSFFVDALVFLIMFVIGVAVARAIWP
jgi:hypothetical protein